MSAKRPSPTRRAALGWLGSGSAALVLAACGAGDAAAKAWPVHFSRAEWKKRLTPAQFHILRDKGTEYPGTSPLLKEHRKGVFVCAADGNPLYSSASKFESGTGWPSFWMPLKGAVGFSTDWDLGDPARPTVRTFWSAAERRAVNPAEIALAQCFGEDAIEATADPAAHGCHDFAALRERLFAKG